MKTKTSVRRTSLPTQPAHRERHPAARLEVRSTTSHSSLLPVGRSFHAHKSQWPNRQAKPVSAAASGFDIPNMEKELYSNAKATGKMQRLRYNFLGSALRSSWRNSPSWSESETPLVPFLSAPTISFEEREF